MNITLTLFRKRIKLSGANSTHPVVEVGLAGVVMAEELREGIGRGI